MNETEKLTSLAAAAGALPSLPGVYIMMDSLGGVIYVGKARALKNRVSSYFHGTHNAKTDAMISKLEKFDVIVVGSDFEALVLENRLIKHHMPKYNILLRDDKGHPFIKTEPDKPYPQFQIVNKALSDKARYLGPYAGRRVAYQAIETVSKALGLPTCSRVFPRDIGRERPCISKDIGICKGWCLPQEESRESEYRKCVLEAIDIFEGNAEALIAPLTAEMNEASEEMRFESAAALRDKIYALREIAKKQVVVSVSRADTDAVGYYRGAAKSCFVVMHYIGGVLLGKDSELIPGPLEDNKEALSLLLRQYYAIRGVTPQKIYLSELPEDAELVEKNLEEVTGRPVKIEFPQRGDKAKLVKYAEMNAREDAERASTHEEKTRKTIEWLGKAMGLDAPPARIESFDISNTGDSGIVAGMVVFENGKPKRGAYRKFAIKSGVGQNDIASLREAVSRRIARFNDGDPKFCPLPDAFLIDGGKTHAKAIETVLRENGANTPVFGMVKDNKHKTRALIDTSGHEVSFESHPAAFAFIGTIQEETHRFAIEYHKTVRSKTVKKSELDGIPGIGERRRRELLKAFGSLRALSRASLEEIKRIIPENAALAVYNRFNSED